MLKEDYPIQINGYVLDIKHQQWNRKYDNVVTANETESGREDIEYVRMGKTTISAQFKVTDELARMFAYWGCQEALTVTFYDVKTDGYISMQMRMTGLQINEVKGSDRLSITNGIYSVTFSLVEF